MYSLGLSRGNYLGSQLSQIFGDRGIFKYGIPSGIFSNEQANVFIYYMSQMCLLIKTPKLHLLSTFDWLADFFMAQSKKSSKDPPIKGQFKSLRSSSYQVVWAPLRTASAASAAHLYSIWTRAVRAHVDWISGPLVVWHVLKTAGSGHGCLSSRCVATAYVPRRKCVHCCLDSCFESHSRSKNRSFSLKIVPNETPARTPRSELMLYWNFGSIFREGQSPYQP